MVETFPAIRASELVTIERERRLVVRTTVASAAELAASVAVTAEHRTYDA